MFSVIIPASNEEQTIGRCIDHVRAIDPGVEIIVADGESHDDTITIAQNKGVIICRSAKGRGVQCNAGAQQATGAMLVFLHADTLLPADAFSRLRAFFQDDRVQIGTFRLSFDVDHTLLRFYTYFTRFDSLFTRFGDQCICVRKAFFDSIGGFPDWPLFEDVQLLRTARKRTRIYSFPYSVTTSARRYMERGIVRQQLFNCVIMAQYLLGVPIERLARKYK